MPDRLDDDWLLDILEECDLIARAIAGRDFAAFDADPILQRAVLHMLQTIGEAAGQLSDVVLDRTPDVPWREMRGMRNRIVHGYFGLDMNAVWLTASDDIPMLATALRRAGFGGA
jgi:uncharacterized protein with HEPN domain